MSEHRVTQQAIATMRRLTARVVSVLRNPGRLVAKVKAATRPPAEVEVRTDTSATTNPPPKTDPINDFSMIQLVTNHFTRDDAGGSAIMLDVGAQRGQFARRFAELGFDVRAFEASPINYVDLVERMRGFPTVTPVNVAVSDVDSPGERFYYSEEFIGVNSLKVNSSHLDSDKYAVVETVRLDSYLGPDACHVSAIKTDIEGADLLALRGFDFANYSPRIVVCEYGGRSAAFDYDVGDLVRHMEKFGYSAWCSSYDSGTGLPYSAKTGVQSKVALRYFGVFERCTDPNWGDVLFFRQEERQRLVEGVARFHRNGATFDLEP